jgi:ubiquinone/menaquinone biosynthesis C-methylase UbiE
MELAQQDSMADSVFLQSFDTGTAPAPQQDGTVTNRAPQPHWHDWASMELPDTWVDEIRFRNPLHLIRFFHRIFGQARKPVMLPDELPGRTSIPKYVLQEFHRLPNGNYSKGVTRGYIEGFDHAMLGVMRKARQHMAQQLRHCHSALDAGCAGGRTAQALAAAGVPDVWGLDPSPYLLQHAARNNPAVRFVQGVAENTDFADQQFDGIAACFLFHEIPPRYAQRALTEFNRILQPGGLVVICEPTDIQVKSGYATLFKHYGFKGIYFGLLARFVFEPFLNAWHTAATPEFFAAFGFECVSDQHSMPLRHIVLRKAEATS